ncbi:TIGR00730 family Rossman fold protein [Aliiroseovarius subalbicans]|uniref:LOG family protein n=1 Tax=Aliiroseovarius subalbicans TaxID=2925840 RepID=UPI001F59FB0A|nr:TIGR00730 family Rossman fold protein [Aliiroseovarius subalbicans]MCI2398690.1 TIGR00730 family Rossman fold protein [Aliiroseovarius subalbicans]
MISPHASVCVYCGSRFGANPAYEADARALGANLAQEGWRLVYGAGDVGLMGAVAQAAQDAGGTTFGVIPEHLLKWEVGKRDLTQFIVTENMHERKKVMFMNSDAIVVMPGGAGSLDEFFEAVTWRQLGLHAKPVFLLNTGGYWNPLVTLIDHVIEQGFAEESLKSYLTLVDDVPALTSALRAALT